jgi:hypothetical protein
MLTYALTVLLGAFLLFQVQPIMGRVLLPWFGGTPAVWSTCMLFFQVLLLGGYAYAHALAGRKSTRGQALVHMCVVAACAAFVAFLWTRWEAPILPGESFRPTDASSPVLRILGILSVAVAAPYLLLAATGPLLQAWFARAFPGRSPYWLYVLSNTGSLAALVTYPFLVEPELTLVAQATAWSLGFLAFAALLAACCVLALRAVPLATPAALDADSGNDAAVLPPPLAVRLLWMALPAAASAMLLATTNQLCQEVAVIPFLWVLPLTIYLLSFIVVFASDRFYWPPFWRFALFAASVGVVIALFEHLDLDILLEVAIYSAFLLVVCMVCHGELVRLRPAPARLTSFYLGMSLGGALGGAFVTLLAPVLFVGLWEFHFGVVAVWLLLAAVQHVRHVEWHEESRVKALKWVLILVGVGLAVPLAIEAAKRYEDAIHSTRNFYGVLRVREIDRDLPDQHSLRLSHGAILHGVQFFDPARRNQPTSYYAEDSGVGLSVLMHPKRLDGQPGMRIGVIGLGVGTMAAYGRKGDTVRFYEINDDVIGLSQSVRPFFTYLRDGPAKVDVVYGDARTSLEQERQSGNLQKLDVLVVDAFSSDSIPVHLLTLEAVRLYFDHLAWDGVLAIHVSNRHLDLARVVWQIARQLEVPTVLIKARGDDQAVWATSWMLLSRNELFFVQPEIADVGDFDPTGGPDTLWTDDYSNLFRVLR